MLRLPFTLLTGLLLGQTAAAADWTDTHRAGPFVCRADYRLNDAGFLHRLSGLSQELTELLGKPPRGLIEIYLFQDRARYESYLKTHFPKVAVRRALYLEAGSGRIVLAYANPRLESDLRHECAHALLHATLEHVPLWLDEGLAVWFEWRQGVGRDVPSPQCPHGEAVRAAAARGEAPSLTALEAQSDYAQLQAADYRAAWAWTDFLLTGPPEARRECLRFLADDAAEQAALPLGRRLEERLGDVGKRYLEHFQRPSRNGKPAAGPGK